VSRYLPRLLLRGLGVLGLVFGGIIAWFMLNESALVFPGQARTELPVVPGPGAEIPWDSLRVQAADGTPTFLLESRLAGNVSGRWAIFFHGNDMLVSDSRGRYELLREAGFNVLAVELRGYGASLASGPAEERGTYHDAMASLTYLTQTAGVPPDSIVVYGYSLGAGPATYLATHAELAGIVTEGAFTSAPDIAVLRYPWLPIRWFMKTRFSNLERADSISEPWLIFHGLDDRVVPFSHSEALAAAASTARVIPLETGHSGGVVGDREVAMSALEAFVIEIFGDVDR
jgi:fermentation-respiration switch protein FrsA (DUF1100 family)